MADEMPVPRAINALANRGKQLDALTDAALKPASSATPKSTESDSAASVSIKPGLADEMAAKSAARKRAQAADDAAASRGAPKPGLIDGLLKKLSVN